MSIKVEITSSNPPDVNDWDTFVLSRSGGSPYHLSAWGKAIQQAYGHKIYFMTVRKGGRLVGVLPLIRLRFPILINELIGLPFCDVGNCLAEDDEALKELLSACMNLGKRLRTNQIQLRGSLQGLGDDDIPFARLSTGKVRMLLELPGSSEILFDKFKPKLRSQIRKAEKNGIMFRWAGKEGVDPFYSVFSENMSCLGSPVHARKLFEAIMEQFGARARIGLTEYEGKCIGAGLILSTNELTAVPWASTLRQYNHLAPNMLLYWNFLKYAADSGHKTFDFGRSTEDEGTYRFKKQWGAVPIPLCWYATPFHMKAADNADQTGPGRREKIAEIWKKLPLPLANFLGPQLRRYINL